MKPLIPDVAMLVFNAISVLTPDCFERPDSFPAPSRKKQLKMHHVVFSK